MAKAARQPDFFSRRISQARRFWFDANPPRNKPLVVVCGGCEHCDLDYEIHRPSFQYWVIEFVAQGRGTLTLNRETCHLVPGMVFSYGPGIAHDIVSDPRAALVKYFVAFVGQNAEALLRRHGPAPGHVMQTAAPIEVLALFDDLIRTGLRGAPLSARMAAVLLEYLVLKIAETAMPVGAADTASFATYRRCQQHIEDHWAQLSTLEQVAEECGVDAAYICRLFRRFHHQSPYQYLLRRKVMHAAERLLDSKRSVKQEAEELGFSDAFHFSRVFKKVMGLSPSEFVRVHHRN
jgi:AraC-like DNA-binding protein